MVASDFVARVRLGTDARGKGTIRSGRRLLQQPRGIRLAADGSLLVADFGSHCVLRFPRGDAKGKVVAGEPGKPLTPVDPLKDIDRPLGPSEGEGFLLMRPLDACEDGNGNILVLDTEACRLQRYFGQGGRTAETVVPPPHGPPQKSNHAPSAVKNPRSVLLQANGDVLLCDTWSHRVLRYSSESAAPEELVGTPNSCGRQANQLTFPSCIALDSQGHLLVADTNNHRIQRFTLGEPFGMTIAGSPDCKAGAGPGELNMPTGLCVDPSDGSVVVADRGNRRVVRFDSGTRAGDAGMILAGSDVLESPWGVCMDPDGSVYVSDEARGLVLRLSDPNAAEDLCVETSLEETDDTDLNPAEPPQEHARATGVSGQPAMDAEAPADANSREHSSPVSQTAASTISGSHLELD